MPNNLLGRTTFLVLIGCLAAYACGSVFAEEVPPPPEAPVDESSDSRNIPEADVVIIHKKDMTVEEYRVNGQLRYAKIIPAKGPPYYMFDSDGDGALDTRYNDLDNPPINQWILFRW